MAIEKKYLKSKPVCKVTFKVKHPEKKEVKVVGDFNQWDENAHVLTRLKSGIFKITVDVPKDETFEFKYLIDGEWVNDESADDYRWNDFANAENGVLHA